MTISKLPPGTLEPPPSTPRPVVPPPVGPPDMPPTTTAPGPVTPPTGTVDTGAKGILQQALDAYGLGSLAEWAWGKFQNGESVDTILSFDLPQTPEFKAAFPEYDILAKRGEAMTPGQIVQYRTGVKQLAQQFGIPPDFSTTQLASDWLLGNVSLSEAQARFSAAQTDILTAPPEKLAEINRLYGMTPGDLLATYVDETVALPILQRKAQAAALGVQAERTGYGQLGATALEQLNLQGVSESQAQQGFAHLASERQLFNPLDQGEQAIGQDVQLGAEFGGNAADVQQIQQRQRRRLATFSGGGGFATGRSTTGAGNVGV